MMMMMMMMMKETFDKVLHVDAGITAADQSFFPASARNAKAEQVREWKVESGKWKRVQRVDDVAARS